MSLSIESVEVARSGAALRVAMRGGERRILRWIDLATLLGRPDVRASRFRAARVTDGGSQIEVDINGSDPERLHATDVAGVAARRPELVLETSGLLMTGEGTPDEPLGLLRGGAVLMGGGGRVLWVGRREDLPRCGFELAGTRRVDADGALVTPGLIDCHAHPIFAGSRADEFAQRAAGKTYLDIAAAGGGIASTVTATRAAALDDLVELACARLDRAVACGTTTMEAKSGYALSAAGELRLLEAALAADALHPVDLEPTLLGAHALPPERDGDRAGYLAEVIDEMVPAAAAGGLARAVDAYCDQGAFTLEETRRVLEAGRRSGLALRAHAGQFADLGAAELVAEMGGLSADHLEQVSPGGIRAMATHGVVAVMLPGACVQLRLDPPPVASMRQAGVAMAVASDLNPGSSLCESLPVQMWLAATHYGMTVDEVWLGVTRHAARALGRADLGVLAPGAIADLVVWNLERPAEVPYSYGAGSALVQSVLKAGRPVMLAR
ncbi:MAG TPA: imidazolonepropionase [Kofleriaceae bacterium]|nr:imidazolonepropionase [Kofleriaceae bacterium]